MKYVKILGLLAAAAVGLVALAGTASATTITSPTGAAFTGIVKAESEGHVEVLNPIATVKCWSNFQGSVNSHGAGNTAKISLGGLSFQLCTNSWHLTVESVGDLEVHWVSSGTGTITSSGLTFDATRFGVTCAYETNNTHIGVLTDSHKTADRATFHIDASIPIEGSSSFLCGSGLAEWLGAYEINDPTALYLDS